MNEKVTFVLRLLDTCAGWIYDCKLYLVTQNRQNTEESGKQITKPYIGMEVQSVALNNLISICVFIQYIFSVCGFAGLEEVV